MLDKPDYDARFPGWTAPSDDELKGLVEKLRAHPVFCQIERVNVLNFAAGRLQRLTLRPEAREAAIEIGLECGTRWPADF